MGIITANENPFNQYTHMHACVYMFDFDFLIIIDFVCVCVGESVRCARRVSV